MTTIVWDGTTLAADRRSTSGSFIGETTKIRRVNGSLVGLTGDGVMLGAFCHWLTTGAPLDKYPVADMKDCCAMVLAGDGKIRIYETSAHPVILDSKAYAIGSGRQGGLAAVKCGRSARDAVLIASEVDCYTGTQVDELRFNFSDRVDPND